MGYQYLNPETFKEGIVGKPDDRFQESDHSYFTGVELRIRSSCREISGNDPLFLALPFHLVGNTWDCHGDRVYALSRERRLLLEISCLDTYMKEYCHLEYKLEGELCKAIHW